ncbi:thioester reductase domain-containing protein [Calothrix sp. NIES-4071]|nr:thioester reductase domain-containing protein [Calothrix sp. NIES-4071]BAZ55712.1 thioester reductase domain-containing protein [Calothrix sp. NIES-4105]
MSFKLNNADSNELQELLITYVKYKFIKVLEINPSQNINRNKPFNELRLDYLMNIELKNNIDTELGVNVPIKIFLGASSINQLVSLLIEQLVAKDTIISKYLSSETDASYLAPDLNSEAALDSTIFPDYTYQSKVNKPASIFLTGTTGFLGAFLLHELLLKTQANIYCLVRSTDDASAKMRIKNNLESYGIWHEDFADRIIPVLGDLSQPLLGLSLQDFQFRSSLIDVIYHNAEFWLSTTTRIKNSKHVRRV